MFFRAKSVCIKNVRNIPIKIHFESGIKGESRINSIDRQIDRKREQEERERKREREKKEREEKRYIDRYF